MAAAAILDFSNREILSANIVQTAEEHQHAKYVKICQSVAKILNFQFFNMAAAAILDIQICIFHWQTVSGGPRLIIVLNIVKIGLSVVDIM